MEEKQSENQAFIDGQNLFLGTTSDKNPWKVDLYRFREYLRKKYFVKTAYYFIGCKDRRFQELYDRILDADYKLIFRAHSNMLGSAKKGNVDTDIVFMTMKNFHETRSDEKFFLVSGDGDYYRMIKYLSKQNRLGKILFPSSRRASSLYRGLDGQYIDYLDKPQIRNKIRRNKNEGSA
jgi:hypothetical protein